MGEGGWEPAAVCVYIIFNLITLGKGHVCFQSSSLHFFLKNDHITSTYSRSFVESFSIELRRENQQIGCNLHNLQPM